jgi:hypothetical protein
LGLTWTLCAIMQAEGASVAAKARVTMEPVAPRMGNAC